MTIEQISKAVSPKDPLPRRQVYRYLAACGIEALKPRKRPAKYPDNSAKLIADHIGLTGGIVDSVTPSSIPSMRQLISERKKARGK